MPEAIQNSADIWFVPPPKHSRWFAQIDWYLNWQLCKGMDYTGLHLPKEVLHVAEQYQVEVPERLTAIEGAPLLVSSSGRVPAQNVVVLGNPSALGDWLKDIEKVSEGLKAKKIQVFLPVDVNRDTAMNSWKKLKSPIEARFITDREIT